MKWIEKPLTELPEKDNWYITVAHNAIPTLHWYDKESGWEIPSGAFGYKNYLVKDESAEHIADVPTKFYAVEYSGFWNIQTDKYYGDDNILDAEKIGEKEAEQYANLIAKLLNEHYMAVYREQQYCIHCKEPLQARYGVKDKSFVGDTFLGYNPCKCQITPENNIDEQPAAVSAGDVEEAAKEWNIDYESSSDLNTDLETAFKAGASWQSQQPVSDAVELPEDTVREIAYIAWKGAANAFRMYPDTKHTFTDYWDAAKTQFQKFKSIPEQGKQK